MYQIHCFCSRIVIATNEYDQNSFWCQVLQFQQQRNKQWVVVCYHYQVSFCLHASSIKTIIGSSSSFLFHSIVFIVIEYKICVQPHTQQTEEITSFYLLIETMIHHIFLKVIQKIFVSKTNSRIEIRLKHNKNQYLFFCWISYKCSTIHEIKWQQAVISKHHYFLRRGNSTWIIVICFN